MEEVDDKLIAMERKLEKERNDLDENSLKMVIDYYSNEKKSYFKDILEEISIEVDKLTKKSLYVCFDEGYLEELSKIVRMYINVREIKW